MKLAGEREVRTFYEVHGDAWLATGSQETGRGEQEVHDIMEAGVTRWSRDFGARRIPLS